MEYVPNYANGQILVVFKPALSYDFIYDFANKLGYPLIKIPDSYSVGHIFKTNIGDEKKAIKQFKKYTKFVEYAELRDLKLEERVQKLDQAIEMINNLSENISLPDELFKGRLNDISKYLKDKNTN